MQKKDKTNEHSQLPESFSSISEASDFWDNHDSTDYNEMMESVEFEVDIKQRSYLVSVAGDMLDSLREIAHAKGISTETFVNLLLQQEIMSKAAPNPAKP